jgi:hypothetical protein
MASDRSDRSVAPTAEVIAEVAMVNREGEALAAVAADAAQVVVAADAEGIEAGVDVEPS